ncbi:hypothetical protein, partial [Desulfovibrio sp. ZJ369]|uniref:hypothetical protein n=1 Tax=Desulfovibrio sp. ZJ369 TaxID=2709793 RepID=UPI0019801092
CRRITKDISQLLSSGLFCQVSLHDDSTNIFRSELHRTSLDFLCKKLKLKCSSPEPVSAHFFLGVAHTPQGRDKGGITDRFAWGA